MCYVISHRDEQEIDAVTYGPRDAVAARRVCHVLTPKSPVYHQSTSSAYIFGETSLLYHIMEGLDVEQLQLATKDIVRQASRDNSLQ